jgi:hypothetical protein
VSLTAIVQAQKAHVIKHRDSGVTVYDRNSPDPNIGWHSDSSGMRMCYNDCDNPKIPGSGARCHDVLGMEMRECVTSSLLL